MKTMKTINKSNNNYHEQPQQPVLICRPHRGTLTAANFWTVTTVKEKNNKQDQIEATKQQYIQQSTNINQQNQQSITAINSNNSTISQLTSTNNSTALLHSNFTDKKNQPPMLLAG